VNHTQIYRKPTRAEVEASLIEAGYTPAERKAPRGKPEDLLHIAVAKFLHLAIGPAGHAIGGVMWFSLEMRNSGKEITTRSGKKINLEGIARKARGCVAGLPDVVVIYDRVFHGIELKAGARVSPVQHERHRALADAGAMVAVAHSVEDVERILRWWDVPLRATVS
jgi:hypothetical protein